MFKCKMENTFHPIHNELYNLSILTKNYSMLVKGDPAIYQSSDLDAYFTIRPSPVPNLQV